MRMTAPGVWLSHYQYFSSGRDGTFEGLHYVVLLQHDSQLTVRSLPGASSNPDSNLSMDLAIEGNVVTAGVKKPRVRATTGAPSTTARSRC
ncbi:hypothetical protein [Myceligenerans halotolerans]